jgi:hypothetical protein
LCGSINGVVWIVPTEEKKGFELRETDSREVEVVAKERYELVDVKELPGRM